MVVTKHHESGGLDRFQLVNWSQLVKIEYPLVIAQTRPKRYTVRWLWLELETNEGYALKFSNAPPRDSDFLLRLWPNLYADDWKVGYFQVMYTTEFVRGNVGRFFAGLLKVEQIAGDSLVSILTFEIVGH